MLTGFLRNSEFTSIQGSFSIQIYQIPVHIYRKLLKCHILSIGEKGELFLCCPCRGPRIEALCLRGGGHSQGQCWKPQDDTIQLLRFPEWSCWFPSDQSKLKAQNGSPEWWLQGKARSRSLNRHQVFNLPYMDFSDFLFHMTIFP